MTAVGETRVRSGWEPDVTADDTFTRAAVMVTAARARHQTASLGGRVEADDDVVMTETGSPNFFFNASVLLAPPTPAVFDRILGFHRGPCLVVSAFPTGDLRSLGLQLMGHPPFMVRPAGGEPPPIPAGLTVDEVVDEAGLLDFEQTLQEAYPIPEPLWTHGGFYGAQALGGPTRFWIGRAGGRPVAVAGSHVGFGVNNVEWVATQPDARGRGFGAAVTWAATRHDPSLPAVLIASDAGRPVYEGMGYLPVSRWTLWFRS